MNLIVIYQYCFTHCDKFTILMEDVNRRETNNVSYQWAYFKNNSKGQYIWKNLNCVILKTSFFFYLYIFSLSSLSLSPFPLPPSPLPLIFPSFLVSFLPFFLFLFFPSLIPSCGVYRNSLHHLWWSFLLLILEARLFNQTLR